MDIARPLFTWLLGMTINQCPLQQAMMKSHYWDEEAGVFDA
jgi:hypothetical protein